MEVEWLILADAAEVFNNKLYLLGGGWESITCNSGFPFRHNFAVAHSFKVPWGETNQRHDIQVEIVDADGQVLTGAGLQIEVGRPPGLSAGQEQRVQLAANVSVEFEGPGAYAVVARIEGQENKRTPFSVAPGPGMAMMEARPGEE